MQSKTNPCSFITGVFLLILPTPCTLPTTWIQACTYPYPLCHSNSTYSREKGYLSRYLFLCLSFSLGRVCAFGSRSREVVVSSSKLPSRSYLFSRFQLHLLPVLPDCGVIGHICREIPLFCAKHLAGNIGIERAVFKWFSVLHRCSLSSMQALEPLASHRRILLAPPRRIFSWLPLAQTAPPSRGRTFVLAITPARLVLVRHGIHLPPPQQGQK